jgi:dihydropteroate synthase-like protein
LKVLAVTGKMAENIVKKYVKEINHDIDVQVLPISVAAFITPEFTIEHLPLMKTKDYDMILLPGSVQGDVSIVEKKIGVPTFKGPNHAADIAVCFEEGVELSKTLSATEVVKAAIKKRAAEKFDYIKNNWEKIYSKYGGLIIGSSKRAIPIGHHFPIPIIAEIVNAPIRSMEEITKLARYYESEGAGIIDVGMIATNHLPEKIPKIIETIRSSVNLPVSIDTLNEDEIIAAARSGIDLILSIDAGNMEKLADVCHDIPVVVLPSNIRKGRLPQEAEARVKSLNFNIKKARRLGYTKIIADPVLEPVFQPGLMNSLKAYNLFRISDKTTPTLFGLGNVSELIDVDSVGVNGLLTAIAYEVDANLLFTPEYSNKTRKSVQELSIASQMMFLAKDNEKVPKDLGIDLFVLKEKRWIEQPREEIYDNTISVHKAFREPKYEPDGKGWFKVQINRDKKEIEALFHHEGDDKPKAIVTGSEATEIYQTIIREKMIGKLDHAAYLGRELAKAEIALRLDRSYVQDEKLF